MISLQGKHQSAIQVYKQHLLKASDNLLPLYKISKQFRHLSFVDAEVEALELLAQVCSHI